MHACMCPSCCMMQDDLYVDHVANITMNIWRADTLTGEASAFTRSIGGWGPSGLDVDLIIEGLFIVHTRN